MSSDLKDWWQGIFHIFQKRTIIVFVVILGFLSLSILFHGGSVAIFNKSIDLSEFVKNPLNPLYLSGLFAISIIPTALILLIWDLIVLGFQKIKINGEFIKKNKLRKSQEAKLKEELKKLPIDEKEFLLRAVINREKIRKNQDYLVEASLLRKGFVKPDEKILFFLIVDFIFNELEKELNIEIEKILPRNITFEDERKFLLLHYQIKGERRMHERLPWTKDLANKQLLLENKDDFIIPQMVWDRLHLLQDENNTDLNKS